MRTKYKSTLLAAMLLTSILSTGAKASSLVSEAELSNKYPNKLSDSLQLSTSLSSLTMDLKKPGTTAAFDGYYEDLSNLMGANLGIKKNFSLRGHLSYSVGGAFSYLESQAGVSTNAGFFETLYQVKRFAVEQRLYYSIPLNNKTILRPYGELTIARLKNEYEFALSGSGNVKDEAMFTETSLALGAEVSLAGSQTSFDAKILVDSELKAADDSKINLTGVQIGVNLILQ